MIKQWTNWTLWQQVSLDSWTARKFLKKNGWIIPIGLLCCKSNYCLEEKLQTIRSFARIELSYVYDTEAKRWFDPDSLPEMLIYLEGFPVQWALFVLAFLVAIYCRTRSSAAATLAELHSRIEDPMEEGSQSDKAPDKGSNLSSEILEVICTHWVSAVARNRFFIEYWNLTRFERVGVSSMTKVSSG